MKNIRSIVSRSGGSVFFFLFVLMATTFISGQNAHAQVPGHEARTIEGWTVHVEEKLLEDRYEEVRRDGLAVLDLHLERIRRTLRENRVRELQQFEFVVDLEHDELTSMQYHNSARYLREHGYEEAMAKMVHIPRIRGLTSRKKFVRQPMVVMHELAHAYHDRVLGLDHDGIKTAFERVRSSGKLEEVLHISGNRTEHYGGGNHQEFFAEMTEAYLGTNDFYPFVYGELKSVFPRVFDLMEEVWGRVP